MKQKRRKERETKIFNLKTKKISSIPIIISDIRSLGFSLVEKTSVCCPTLSRLFSRRTFCSRSLHHNKFAPHSVNKRSSFLRRTVVWNGRRGESGSATWVSSANLICLFSHIFLLKRTTLLCGCMCVCVYIYIN